MEKNGKNPSRQQEGKNAIILSFELGDDQSSLSSDIARSLISHKDKFTGMRRLCIPESCLTEIFQPLHGGKSHPGFAKSFDLAQRAWYIRNLSKHLRAYIKHCPECQLLQIRRHKPWGSL